MNLENHSLSACFSAMKIFATALVLPRSIAWHALGHGHDG